MSNTNYTNIKDYTMLNWTITNDINTGHQETYSVQHMILVNDTNNTITISRIPMNGGYLKRVVLNVKPDESFTKIVKQINKICELDDELYQLMVEHTASLTRGD